MSSYKKAVNKLKEGSGTLPELYDQAQTTADKRVEDNKREQEETIDKYAEIEIRKVKRWQESQKKSLSEDIWYISEPEGKRTQFRSDIKTFTSNVQALNNSASEKIPSLSETKMLMTQLRKMKKKCQSLRNIEFSNQSLTPINVVIGRR